MATTLTNTQQTPSPELIQFLYNKGMVQEAKELERKWGLSTETEDWLLKFITQDEEMIKLKEKIRKLAPEDDPVLIQGETGTGKELLARALHGARKGKFVAINCAGMPRELVESELFGHAQGSFTGATKAVPGLIEVAEEGTLFLDEIGDLAFDTQAKLLRVLQERTIRAVGGKEDKKIDVRFVAASHFNLAERVKESKFRLDLYARLSTFELFTKPLKDRIGDIPLIARSLGVDISKFQINWKEIDLTLNVRTIQQIIRRYQVLGTLPKR